MSMMQSKRWQPLLPVLGDTDTAAGEAHKPGGVQGPAPLLALFALRPQEGKTNYGKGLKEKAMHNAVNGSDKLVTNQVASSILTNLLSVKLQNNVFSPDPDVFKVWRVLKTGE